MFNSLAGNVGRTTIAAMELVATLLIVGALLLLLETILPGMIAGMIGFGCLIAGVVLAYNRFGVQAGNTILFIVLVGLITGTMFWLKYFPTSRVAQPFISKRRIGTIRAEKPELLDQTGTALTSLRPSGTALINGQRVDVVTEGGMIDRGAAIKVVQIEGMRVVVRAIENQESSGDKL